MDLSCLFLGRRSKTKVIRKEGERGIFRATLPWKCIPQGEAPICPPTGNRCCACIYRYNSRKSLGHRNWRICTWNHARPLHRSSLIGSPITRVVSREWSLLSLYTGCCMCNQRTFLEREDLRSRKKCNSRFHACS